MPLYILSTDKVCMSMYRAGTIMYQFVSKYSKPVTSGISMFASRCAPLNPVKQASVLYIQVCTGTHQVHTSIVVYWYPVHTCTSSAYVDTYEYVLVHTSMYLVHTSMYSVHTHMYRFYQVHTHTSSVHIRTTLFMLVYTRYNLVHTML